MEETMEGISRQVLYFILMLRAFLAHTSEVCTLIIFAISPMVITVTVAFVIVSVLMIALAFVIVGQKVSSQEHSHLAQLYSMLRNVSREWSIEVFAVFNAATEARD